MVSIQIFSPVSMKKQLEDYLAILLSGKHYKGKFEYLQNYHRKLRIKVTNLIDKELYGRNRTECLNNFLHKILVILDNNETYFIITKIFSIKTFHHVYFFFFCRKIFGRRSCTHNGFNLVEKLDTTL